MTEPKTEIESSIETVSERLGYRFRNSDLLVRALTHKSFSNEHPGICEDNQRLEFLGDAVFGLAVAEALIKRTDLSEGQMTSRRAALVNESSLAELAVKIDLGSAIRLGRGEEINDGRTRPSMLADAAEAVVGAVYLDGGFEEALAVALRWLGPSLDEIVECEPPADAKTILQEILQAKNAGSPTYQVVKEEGPDHDKIFEVELAVNGAVLARGRGKSKKEAEKDAAGRALAAAEELTCAE